MKSKAESKLESLKKRSERVSSDGIQADSRSGRLLSVWIVLSGILLRLYYILATPVVQSRQYDLGSAVPEKGIFTGHLGYIFYLYTKKGLPDFDPREVYQFFHPPLHHAISAMWLEVLSHFTSNKMIWMTEWLQVLPFVYSVLILLVIWQICREFQLTGRAQCFVMAMVSFHPSLIFMAGSINNDGLSLLFQFLTIWLALRWYRKRDYWNILGLAFSIALGMLTKLSVGMFAIPVGFLFLYVFFTEWKEGAQKSTLWQGFPIKRFWQYAAFALVCIPVGLSWAVRCLVRFGMPLTYVNHLPEQSWQYVGNYSLMERFFIPNPIELIKNLAHGQIGFGENVWVQLFRTSALGECDLSTFPMWGKLVALLMIAAAFVLAVWAFVLLVRVFVLGKKETFSAMDMGIRCFWLIGYLVLFGSYLSFCYNFPHQCTMNFRYMVPTVLYPAVAAGLAVQHVDDMQETGMRGQKGRKWTACLQWVICAYAVISVLTIIVWSISV